MRETPLLLFQLLSSNIISTTTTTSWVTNIQYLSSWRVRIFSSVLSPSGNRLTGSRPIVNMANLVETLVEVRSDSTTEIYHRTWVQGWQYNRTIQSLTAPGNFLRRATTEQIYHVMRMTKGLRDWTSFTYSTTLGWWEPWFGDAGYGLSRSCFTLLCGVRYQVKVSVII